MNRVNTLNSRPRESGRNPRRTLTKRHHNLLATLVLLGGVGIPFCVSAAEPVAEAPRERNAADCGSPLATYDPNRELGLGEAKPEEPDKPLRRFLYLNMQDSSEGTYSRGGIVVLDLDNNLKFVKRINCSPMMMKGGTSANSLSGVRWQHGSAITDRLYYGYWSPGAQFMNSINPASPIPDKANAVVGCLDLRTDQTLWEQPTYNACATGVFPDGKRLLSLPHWSKSGYGKLSILDAMSGKVLQTIDALGCHGVCVSASGRFIWKEAWLGPFQVIDCQTLAVVPGEEAFPGLLQLSGWEALPVQYKDALKAKGGQLRGVYNDVLRANGREDLLWSQIRAWKLPGMASGGQMSFDLANHRVAFSPVNAVIIGNAIDSDKSITESIPNYHYVYDTSISADERWFYHGPCRGDIRVTVWDNTVWPPRHVGIMGEGLFSKAQPDLVSGGWVGNGNKSGAWTSLDGTRVYTSDSWYFCPRTWKPMGLMRDEKGGIIRCSKMNEVYFRGKDCVHFGQRYGYGRYKEPAKIFPFSTDKTPPSAISDLKAAMGEPSPRWAVLNVRLQGLRVAGGAITVEVKLTWSPATDNEGVQRYAIWRDGELIGNCLGVNPGLDPVLSHEDQAEYEKQVGKFEPNTFKARYLEPGKTYKFEVEPMDFAQNRGPRAAISVEVAAVSNEKRLELVKARIAQIAERAEKNQDKSVRGPCVEAILALLTTHKLAKADALPFLDRLAPLANGEDRDAKAIRLQIEGKRKELEGNTP